MGWYTDSVEAGRGEARGSREIAEGRGTRCRDWQHWGNKGELGLTSVSCLGDWKGKTTGWFLLQHPLRIAAYIIKHLAVPYTDTESSKALWSRVWDYTHFVHGKTER